MDASVSDVKRNPSRSGVGGNAWGYVFVSAMSSVLFLSLSLFVPCSLLGQATGHASRTQEAIVRVPFVGCESDGQVGPVDAPQGQSKVVTISAESAQRLAYYKADNGVGTLAPRGWHCFGTYGSSGSTLYVSPKAIKSADVFSKGFGGTAIQISTEYGGTSGRFGVAKVIARVFPAHLRFVKHVIAEGIMPASSFPSGPYAKDKLTYRSNEIVEFQTPANSKGLGTGSGIQNSSPVSGVAILFGEETNLLQLSVRLSLDTNNLAQAIIQQTEYDAVHLGH